jgi:hypothetical protein
MQSHQVFAEGLLNALRLQLLSLDVLLNDLMRAETYFAIHKRRNRCATQLTPPSEHNLGTRVGASQQSDPLVFRPHAVLELELICDQ